MIWEVRCQNKKCNWSLRAGTMAKLMPSIEEHYIQNGHKLFEIEVYDSDF